MIVKFIDFLRDRLKIVIWLCYAIMGFLVVNDALLVDKHHAHTSVEHFPGFWSIFAFIVCVIMIIVGNSYAEMGIMTREDYYDK